MEEIMKNCVQCGKRLRGRSDKKFCGPNCRNESHNARTNEKATVRLINRMLRRNRQILEALHAEEGKKKVSKELMLQSGFHFGYATHRLCSRQGRMYDYCYEYGYRDLGNGLVALVKLAPGIQLLQ